MHTWFKMISYFRWPKLWFLFISVDIRVDSTEKMAFEQQTEPIKRKSLPITYKDKAYEFVGVLVWFHLHGRTVPSGFPVIWIIDCCSEEVRVDTSCPFSPWSALSCQVVQHGPSMAQGCLWPCEVRDMAVLQLSLCPGATLCSPLPARALEGRGGAGLMTAEPGPKSAMGFSGEWIMPSMIWQQNKHVTKATQIPTR